MAIAPTHPNSYFSYAAALYEKRVAIVGGWDVEEDLSSFDVVIRINDHWLRQSGPCNVLFHNANVDPGPLFATCRPQFLIYNIRGTFRRAFNRFAEKHDIPSLFIARERSHPFGVDSWAHTLKRICEKSFDGCVPYTGTEAIFHTLTFPVKEVYVTGMNLYFDRGREFWDGCEHGVLGQVKLLKYLREAERRVYYNEDLAASICEILKDYDRYI